jgi:hypothetical protein
MFQMPSQPCYTRSSSFTPMGMAAKTLVKMYLVLVDAHSKWVEAMQVPQLQLWRNYGTAHMQHRTHSNFPRV